MKKLIIISAIYILVSQAAYAQAQLSGDGIKTINVTMYPQKSDSLVQCKKQIDELSNLISQKKLGVVVKIEYCEVPGDEEQMGGSLKCIPYVYQSAQNTN